MKLASLPGLVAVGLCMFPATTGVADNGEKKKNNEKPSAQSSEKSSLGLRVDCMHDFNAEAGSGQPCFRITGLRYRHTEQVNPEVTASLTLDPFAPTSESDAKTPRRRGIATVQDTDFVLIADYALTWYPRPNLEVALEEYGGAAKIPDTSGLALGGEFPDRGWDQTALTVTYNLSTFRKMKVRFAAGNGEGENGRNLDPQQYFGVEADATLIKGVRANIGSSFDGNSFGSQSYRWRREGYEENCGWNGPDPDADNGYSTQRLSAGVMLDGNLPAARGLKVGLGWQRSVLSDLDKDSTSHPLPAEWRECPAPDPGELFVEDPDQDDVNTVQRTVIGINASYRILDTYFVGLDYETRRIDSGSVDMFVPCGSFKDGTCKKPGEAANQLSQMAYTLGAGVNLTKTLTLTLEYNTTEYDDTYSLFHYRSPNGEASDTAELFNARIAYNW